MRWLPLALLLTLPALGGCLEAFRSDEDPRLPTSPADVGFDPDSITVTGFERVAVSIPSFDGTALASVLYVPTTPDTLPGGAPVPWGTVVFLHGWGFFKEQFEGLPGATGAPIPPEPGAMLPYGVNRMQAFAEAGLIAVAYDARGFGRSGGSASVAGPAEMADLDAVLDYVAAHYPTNGFVGLIGQSYGAGQSFLAWADNPRITTAIPMYGWVDLYEGLAQGNVPKAEWAATLVGVGAAGSQANLSPIVAEWLEKAATRTDLETVQAQMALRSAGPRLPTTDKPLLVCQGLQETLFPQADLAWQSAGGFTRAIIATGGHGVDDPVCWQKALEWSRHFLGGQDMDVASWPPLSTVDASGSQAIDYAAFPRAAWQSFYLRPPGGFASDPSNGTFDVAQRGVANPFLEPTVLWDQLNQPNNAIPEPFRQDPSTVTFEGSPLTHSEVLIGAPTLSLHLADNATATPFQVAAVLYHVDANGRSRVLSRAAAAAISDADLDNGTLELRFWWTKADLAVGDKLVLTVGANDPSTWLPLLANYAVTFDGQSVLRVPYFQG
jgi:alpha/beta superfamily hydrolase